MNPECFSGDIGATQRPIGGIVVIMKGMGRSMSIGERVAYYRRRRGLSQIVLAELVGRTENWLHKVETGKAKLDRLSVIASLAEALDVSISDLLPDDIAPVAPDHQGQSVPALRRLVVRYQTLAGLDADVSPIPLHELVGGVNTVWDAYQASSFGYCIARLNQLLPVAHSTCRQSDGNSRSAAAAQLAYLYQVAASVLVKVGETDLAGRCAERGDLIARDSGDPVAQLSLTRSTAHTLLSSGLYEESLSVVHGRLSQDLPKGPEGDSTAGTLMLVGAMAAARLTSRPEADALLRHAGRLADRLSGDANYVWTAFGPTNVGIHRVSVAAELGDMQLAAHLGDSLRVDDMPRERQVRHRLELARALDHVGRRQDSIHTVLSAEQAAPDQVRRHFLTHELVHGWTRLHRPPTGVTSLSLRLGHRG